MYPSEPWDLRGQMYLSVFAVPRAALAPLPAPLAATAPAGRPGGSPSAVRLVSVGARALVGAAWVSYEPGGVLQYRELLAAVLTHERGRPRVTITEIWVDSVASRDGGRELWGIPKDLAELTVSPATASAAGIAGAVFSRGVRLPGRWPTDMRLAQALKGEICRTPVRGRAGVRLGRATWRFDPAGPLGYLRGRRPLLTVTLADFRLRFGAVSPHSHPAADGR